MWNFELGEFEFVAGGADFMSYWLPLVAFMGNTEDSSHTAHVMLLKYRTAFATKEGAKIAARQDLADMMSEVSKIENLTLKTMRIIELAADHNYYPTPEYYPEWKNEWNLNGLDINLRLLSLH